MSQLRESTGFLDRESLIRKQQSVKFVKRSSFKHFDKLYNSSKRSTDEKLRKTLNSLAQKDTVWVQHRRCTALKLREFKQHCFS